MALHDDKPELALHDDNPKLALCAVNLVLALGFFKEGYMTKFLNGIDCASEIFRKTGETVEPRDDTRDKSPYSRGMYLAFHYYCEPSNDIPENMNTQRRNADCKSAMLHRYAIHNGNCDSRICEENKRAANPNNDKIEYFVFDKVQAAQDNSAQDTGQQNQR